MGRDFDFIIANPDVEPDYEGIATELARLFPDPWALLREAEARDAKAREETA
jgi:hypothetical protein